MGFHGNAGDGRDPDGQTGNQPTHHDRRPLQPADLGEVDPTPIENLT